VPKRDDTRTRYMTWGQAVLRVLGDHYPRAVDLQTIYAEVGRHMDLTEYDLKETKWGELHYEHTVRATACDLVKKGAVDRIRRSVYVLME